MTRSATHAASLSTRHTIDTPTDFEAVPATRDGLLSFARRASEHGTLNTTVPGHPGSEVHRVVTLDPDRDGAHLLLIAMDLTAARIEVDEIDFDLDADDADAHLLHSDGRGVSLRGGRGVAWVTHRLG